MLPSILSWWNCIFSRGWTCWRFISSWLCCCLLRTIVRGLQLMECHGDRVLALADRKQDTCWSGMRWVWLAMFFCLQQENHSAAFLLDLFELFLEVYRDLQSSDFPRVHSSLPCSWGTSPPSRSCCSPWQWRYPQQTRSQQLSSTHHSAYSDTDILFSASFSCCCFAAGTSPDIFGTNANVLEMSFSW